MTIGMTFHASEHTSWTAKYGYFTNDDDEAGGFNDYDAHFIVVSLGYQF